MITTNDWCWHIENKEQHTEGPFDSYNDALENAKEYIDLDKKTTIIIGKVTKPEFADYIEQVFDIDFTLERADEAAFDRDGFGYEDNPTFDIIPEHYNELYDTVKQWADKYIYSDCWSISKTEQQKVTLFNNKVVKE